VTTIAFDGRYIAIDSRVCGGSYIYSDSYNKTVDRGGYVFFMAGENWQHDDFIESFLAKEKMSSQCKTFAYAFNRASKEVFTVEYDKGEFKATKLCWHDAEGSGAAYAVAAMDCGLSAVDAIRAASKRNTQTGGIIRCLDTATGKFIKVKQ